MFHFEMGLSEELIQVLCTKELNYFLTCGGCGKNEPADECFNVCGRCEGAAYCSRDCQVSNWKQHKIFCDYARAEHKSKQSRKALRRMQIFFFIFGELLVYALKLNYLLILKKGFKESISDWIFSVIMFDAPSKDFPNAKKPNLRIHTIYAEKICDLSDDDKLVIQSQRKIHSSSMGETEIVTFAMWYQYPDGNSYKMIMVRPVIGTPPDLSDTPISILESMCSTFVDDINSIAEGKRPDLYDAIQRSKNKKHDKSVRS